MKHEKKVNNTPYHLFTEKARKLCEQEREEREEAKEHYVQGIQGVDGGTFKSREGYYE